MKNEGMCFPIAFRSPLIRLVDDALFVCVWAFTAVRLQAFPLPRLG